MSSRADRKNARRERQATSTIPAGGGAAALASMFQGPKPPGVKVAAWSPFASPPANGAAHAGAASAPSTTNGAHANGSAPSAPATEQAPPFKAGWTYNGDQQQKIHEQEQRQYARPSAPMPQGETSLQHSWAHCVLDRKWDPRGITIWFQSQGSDNYEFYLTGASVVMTKDGQPQPARAVYDAANVKRRRRGEAETFIARIEAPTTEGKMITVGGGYITFPPEPDAPPAQPNGWSVPQGSPPNGGYPQQYPQYGGQPPPMVWNGYQWVPAAAPPGTLPYYPQNQQPPQSVQNNPSQLDAWIKMRTAENDAALAQMKFQQEQARADREEARAERERERDRDRDRYRQSEPEPIDKQLDRWLNITDKLRGKGGGDDAPKRGITIHRVDGETIVETKDGDIDPVATGILSVGKDLRSVIKARATAAVAAAKTSGNGGAGPGVSTAGPPGLKNGGR